MCNHLTVYLDENTTGEGRILTFSNMEEELKLFLSVSNYIRQVQGKPKHTIRTMYEQKVGTWFNYCPLCGQELNWPIIFQSYSK